VAPLTGGEVLTPKLVTVLREGYGWSKFRGDAVAGQTEGGGIDSVPRLGAARPRKACDLERGGPWGFGKS